MLHIFPQNQIHLFLHSLTHSCTTSFLSTCLVSNTLIGSRGAKMNILKVGTLNGLETQKIRVTFLNQRYLAFHFLCKCQNPASALEFPQDNNNTRPPFCFTTCNALLLAFSPGLFLYDEWHMGTSLSDTRYLNYILHSILPDSFGDYRELI